MFCCDNILIHVLQNIIQRFWGWERALTPKKETGSLPLLSVCTWFDVGSQPYWVTSLSLCYGGKNNFFNSLTGSLSINSNLSPLTVLTDFYCASYDHNLTLHGIRFSINHIMKSRSFEYKLPESWCKKLSIKPPDEAGHNIYAINATWTYNS